jgi:biopolymer transport protein ExbB/TolQ
MNPVSQFATFYQSGGPFMHAILLAGVAMLAISLERFWVIARAAAWNSDKLLADLVEKVERGDLRGASDLANRVGAPAGRVAAAILSTDLRDEEKMLNAADGEAAIALPPLSRRLPLLVLLANIATLLGLLGTIFGLITAFSAVGAADPAQRSTFLARGISEALNTTAFGLIFAVPGLLLHGFFAGRVERIVEQVDMVAVRLVRSIEKRRMAATAGGEAPRAHAVPAPAGLPVAGPGASRPSPARPSASR